MKNNLESNCNNNVSSHLISVSNVEDIVTIKSKPIGIYFDEIYGSIPLYEERVNYDNVIE